MNIIITQWVGGGGGGGGERGSGKHTHTHAHTHTAVHRVGRVSVKDRTQS